MNLSIDAPLDEYEIATCAPEDLSQSDLESCIAVIEHGGAVNSNTMRRDLPRSSLLAVVRSGSQVVAVGALKPKRLEYAATVSNHSGVSLPPDALELGYVSVHQNHLNRGLSRVIAAALAFSNTGYLFATTDQEWMKKTLQRIGFERKGKEWAGHRGTISFWERS